MKYLTKWRDRWLVAVLAALLCAPVLAVIEIAPLSRPELEARYRELIEELRCPKCQNQNLAASDSPIAADLREQVRVLLEEGRSDDEIVAFLVDRYGEFVRYRPAVQSNTALLWFGPAALLVAALAVAFVALRKNRRPVSGTAELTAAERQRLSELLGDGRDNGEGDHRA